MTTITREQSAKPMNQAEVMEAINNDDRTAQELLLDVMPTAVTRFNRVTASLNALLIDIASTSRTPATIAPVTPCV